MNSGKRLTLLISSLALIVAIVSCIVSVIKWKVSAEALLVSQEATKIAKEARNTLHGIQLEYLAWRAGVKILEGEDLEIILEGERRKETASLKDIEVTIKPLYRKEGQVDDPLDDRLPKLVVNNHYSTLLISKILESLRTKYDGQPELLRLTSPNTYELYAVYVQVRYWHFTSYPSPVFQLEGIIKRKEWESSPGILVRLKEIVDKGVRQ